MGIKSRSSEGQEAAGSVGIERVHIRNKRDAEVKNPQGCAFPAKYFVQSFDTHDTRDFRLWLGLGSLGGVAFLLNGALGSCLGLGFLDGGHGCFEVKSRRRTESTVIFNLVH